MALRIDTRLNAFHAKDKVLLTANFCSNRNRRTRVVFGNQQAYYEKAAQGIQSQTCRYPLSQLQRKAVRLHIGECGRMLGTLKLFVEAPAGTHKHILIRHAHNHTAPQNATFISHMSIVVLHTTGAFYMTRNDQQIMNSYC